MRSFITPELINDILLTDFAMAANDYGDGAIPLQPLILFNRN